MTRVDDLLFLIDFVILDTPKDAETPLLLGRPFLATGRALTDVERGELILWINKEQVVFNVFEAMKHTNEDLQCYQIDLIDELINNVSKEEGPSSPSEKVLVHYIEKTGEDKDNVEVSELVLQLQAAQLERDHKKIEESGGSSEEKPMDHELKELLEHLKYLFKSGE